MAVDNGDDLALVLYSVPATKDKVLIWCLSNVLARKILASSFDNSDQATALAGCFSFGVLQNLSLHGC
jgi:hypothetical protein